MPFEVYAVVIKNLLGVVLMVGVTQQIVRRNAEIFGENTHGFEVRLFPLRLIAGVGGTLFI